MFQTKAVEKIKTHILCSITFLFENRAVYEIMWKNIVERGRPHTTIRRMRIACWVLKATDTHSGICNTYCFSTVTMVAGKRLSITLHAHCLSCWVMTPFSQVGGYKRFEVTCCLHLQGGRYHETIRCRNLDDQNTKLYHENLRPNYSLSNDVMHRVTPSRVSDFCERPEQDSGSLRKKQQMH